MATQAEFAAKIRQKLPERYAQATDDSWIINDWARSVSESVGKTEEEKAATNQRFHETLKAQIPDYQPPGSTSPLWTGAKGAVSGALLGLPGMVPGYYSAQEAEDNPWSRNIGEIAGGLATGGGLAAKAAKAGWTGLKAAAPLFGAGLAEGAGFERSRQDVESQMGLPSGNAAEQLAAMATSGAFQGAANLLPFTKVGNAFKGTTRIPYLGKEISANAKNAALQAVLGGAAGGAGFAGAESISRGELPTQEELVRQMALQGAIGLGFHGLHRGAGRAARAVRGAVTPAEGTPTRTPEEIADEARRVLDPNATGPTRIPPGETAAREPLSFGGEPQEPYALDPRDSSVRSLYAHVMERDYKDRKFELKPGSGSPVHYIGQWVDPSVRGPEARLVYATPNEQGQYTVFHPSTGTSPATFEMVPQQRLVGPLGQKAQIMVVNDPNTNKQRPYKLRDGFPPGTRTLPANELESTLPGGAGKIFGYVARREPTPSGEEGDFRIEFFGTTANDPLQVGVIDRSLFEGNTEVQGRLAALEENYLARARDEAKHAREEGQRTGEGEISRKTVPQMELYLQDVAHRFATTPNVIRAYEDLGIPIPGRPQGGSGSSGTPPPTDSNPLPGGNGGRGGGGAPAGDTKKYETPDPVAAQRASDLFQGKTTEAPTVVQPAAEIDVSTEGAETIDQAVESLKQRIVALETEKKALSGPANKTARAKAQKQLKSLYDLLKTLTGTTEGGVDAAPLAEAPIVNPPAAQTAAPPYSEKYQMSVPDLQALIDRTPEPALSGPMKAEVRRLEQEAALEQTLAAKKARLAGPWPF